MINAIAVLLKENLDAKIPTANCAGDAVTVLYNKSVFVNPYEVNILFIMVSRP